jgi:FtsX-like permease family
MAAVLYRLRAALRTDWRSLVVVTLLVALAGGAVLSAAGAARRTASAYAGMRQATNAWDVLVNPNDGAQSPLTVAEIRAVPGVEAVGREDGVVLYPSFIGSPTKAFAMPPVLMAANRDADYRIGRPLMVSGRQPAPGDPNGVWVERTYALAHHLHVGQTFAFTIITHQLLDKALSQHSEAQGVAVIAHAPADLRGHLRIDGIGVTIDDVVVDPGYQPASLELTPAFRAAHPQLQVAYWGALVKLVPGTSMNAFTARVRALDPHESIAFQRASAVTTEVDQATGPQVIALAVFAALAALLGLVLVSQAFSRRMQVDARQNPILAAMGITRPERMAASMAKALLPLTVGTVLALALAVLTSGLGPVGVVRIAEVRPGLAVDWPLLLIGGAALLVVGSVLAAVPAWHWSRTVAPTGAASRSRVATSVATAGGSPAAVIGVRFALESGTGRSSVPVRTTILAAVTAVVLVTSVSVFSASLDHLAAAPRLYGEPWSGMVELDDINSSNGPTTGDPAAVAAAQHEFVAVADHSGAVARSSLLDVGEIRSGQTAIPAVGLVPRHPGLTLTVSQGRAPRAADEVALGGTTMDRLHTRIGESIPLALGEQGSVRQVRVVGRAILPDIAPYPGSDKAGLGVGALLTGTGWQRFSSDYEKTEYLFGYRPGRSLAELTAAFRRSDPKELPLTITPADRPAGVVSLERLRATPALLGSLIVLLLGAAVANALVVAVRRRGHDLAVLRTLGFTRGQVVRTVLWQATTVGIVALVIGIPVGVVVGRWTWTLLTERLGTVPLPLVSVASLVAVALAVLALAVAVGIGPGLRAARSPGRLLRAE